MWCGNQQTVRIFSADDVCARTRCCDVVALTAQLPDPLGRHQTEKKGIAHATSPRPSLNAECSRAVSTLKNAHAVLWKQLPIEHALDNFAICYSCEHRLLTQKKTFANAHAQTAIYAVSIRGDRGASRFARCHLHERLPGGYEKQIVASHMVKA